jgi:hypothetical protein
MLTMRRFATATLCGVGLTAMMAGPALAFHCPALVKECQTTADIIAKRPGSDMAMVEKGRKGCEEALKLHQAGKHTESMVRVGQAIAEMSEGLK